MVYRIYAEKRPAYAVEAASLLAEIRELLGITGVTGLRILNRYDVEGVSEALFDRCRNTVFSEPPVDFVYDELPEGADAVFAVEYLPGQFDQRASSAAECIQLLSQGERPAVRSARVYLLTGSVTDEELAEIQHYTVNPVEARLASLEKPDTLHMDYAAPADVATIEGFTALDADGLAGFAREYGLAMDAGDLAFCQAYFRSEQREPTVTELRVIDTYWSDHCRHTTFGTLLDDVKIEDKTVRAAWARYQKLRENVYGERRAEKPVCLMDLATIGAKYLKKTGALKNLDESDEINACSVRITVDNNGTPEPWLLLFKNETHNHPTEIEPFGGAATCIGGAIRDPLANRGYVYQAMRVTGAGDPLVPVRDTIKGKLPQRKLVTTAAAGYSSYGNQIGLATGLVDEIYHPGYIAKRMEIGAVVGAVPEANVRREAPAPGDVVILLGGRTGRDGIGGATGSSKAHKVESLATCGAEVQKGNAPEERKLQRLFRDPDAVRLIKRCNDFGAGGVCVAIGELADGLLVDLDKVPKKYEGLDGTELAISESQERMAVVVEEKDAQAFIDAANRENLEATVVASVTETPRMELRWRGKTICNLARSFLASNGAEKHTDVHIAPRSLPVRNTPSGANMAEKLTAWMGSLALCSRKGLAERFDSTIGAGTVLMPFGGRTQRTPAQAMAAKLPVPHGETRTCSGMAWGYNPFIAEQSEYHGAYLAVVESVSKLVAAGFDAKNAYLTFQEYFERMGTDPARWGRPAASLLGALDAQVDLGVAAIGGKDSMSGSFEDIDVPPTLVSFAVAAGDTRMVTSPEFKQAGAKLVLLRPAMRDELLPDAKNLKQLWEQVTKLIRERRVRAVSTVSMGGIAAALFRMGLGNRLGVRFAREFDVSSLFDNAYGSFVLETAGDVGIGTVIGETTGEYVWKFARETVDLARVDEPYESKLEPVLPWRSAPGSDAAMPVPALCFEAPERRAPHIGCAKPRVFIPVFPGTNCEDDSARAIERAGGVPDIFVVNNLTPARVAESVAEAKARIAQSQVIFLPGGFSGGDEPEGSAKFITAFFRSPALTEAVRELLQKRDGLMLGICNGFQALIKLGLLPYGDIRDQDENSPTLTFNTIGRHQSMLVRTRVASTRSPWLQYSQVGDIHTIAISHGEGRLAASEEEIVRLSEGGMLATQYVDLDGRPTMDVRYNPNGSVWAVEAVSSPDGRILGKMGHSERFGRDLYKNVPGEKDQKLFEGGMDYFK